MSNNGIKRTPSTSKKKTEPKASARVSKRMMPPDGSDLMVRFVQGDEGAFEELMILHENSVLNFFYRLTGERHAAEDMTQELFLKVFNYRDSYSPQASFKSFLFRMARNMWIDQYRKRKVRPREYSLQVPTSRGNEDGRQTHMEESIRSDGASPPEEAVQGERLAKLGEAVDGLPVKLKEVVALCLEGKLRYAEIAEVLGVPVGTIKSRMHTAVMRLKDMMGEV